MSEERTAWGWGLASVDAAGTTLGEAFKLHPADGDSTTLIKDTQTIVDLEAYQGETLVFYVVACPADGDTTVVSQLDEPISNAADAYLKLHLMSMRMAKPNTLNLDGIFAQLANVVWTNYGPFAVEDFTLRKADVERASTEAALAFASQAGLPAAAPAATVNVFGVDKFPRMIDYVVPTGVRLGDADRVRLGAYLSSGTTVMHAGFVNFNAGTLGVSMVEGRVSQGVVVGDGADIGGGASIMGTLSGGGKLRNSIGEHSLLGANAGIGISLGDNCTVEAGLYITAGTKITIWDKAKAAAGEPLEVVKGAELSGKDNILFIRNSVNGRIEARYRKVGIELNAKLHKN